MIDNTRPKKSVTYRKATLDDAEALLKRQYLCYQSEAELYGHHIQPLTQRLHEVVAEIKEGHAFVAVIEGWIVGGVRCRVKDKVIELGKLICHPRVQGQGIGSQPVMLVEESASHQLNLVEVRLFTGVDSRRNLRFYENRGYTKTYCEAPDRQWIAKCLVPLSTKTPP